MENFKETNTKEFLQKTNLLLKEKFPIKHAFLGIGSDGHTASLFPGRNMVSRDDESFFYIKKRGESYQRMTLSMHFLLNMPNLTFLVSGKSKHNPLQKILNGCNINDKSPAHQLVDQSNGQVSIFCDQEAWPGKVYA
jgi:6-phosphogluconolactonase